MQSTTVRRAPGSGVSVGLRSLLTLTGGSIEDNEGMGVHVLPVPGNGGAVVFRSPVRITRNGSYGLVAPMWALYGVLSTQDGWDAIQGNGADTIIAPPILGWFSTDYASGPAVLREGAVVTTRPTCSPGQIPYSLVMEPGSRLALTETASCEFGSDVAIPLRINGTTEQPVRITGAGATLSPTWSDTVRITHAIISGLRLRVRFAPAVIEYAKFDSSEIQLSTAGSRLQHTQLIRATGAAVTVTNGGVELSDCLIRHSTGDGVHVVDGSARINRCDLENNAGVGVRNSIGAEVDATDNWWGDPQGPLVPGGDGVEGSVRFTPFRSVPVRFSANKTAAAPRPPSRGSWRLWGGHGYLKFAVGECPQSLPPSIIRVSSALNTPERRQETMPMYLCLQRNVPGASGAQPSPSQMQEMYSRFNVWREKFKDNLVDTGGKLGEGRFVAERSVADGPFVEVKELVGGYMIVAADSLEEAIEVARECPGLVGVGSGVEVIAIHTP